MTFTTKPVDFDIWEDFESLFEGRGGPGYCWCMAWRDMQVADRNDRAAKKAAMRERVAEGVPIGLLGYDADTPVAWCSVGPRASFRKLGGPDDLDDDLVWSLVCFYVRREHRRQAFSRKMLAAAIDYARANGATILEAYPVDPDSPSYRFMGFVSLFEKAGFEKAGEAGSRRHVMRLAL